MRLDLSGLRRASTRGLVGAIAGVILGAAAPGYLTYVHFQDRQILADRGVRVEAWIADVDRAHRGADTVHVRPVDPPYFESTLESRPGHSSVGDRFDVVFDPLDPGRIAPVGQPLIDSGDLVFVAIDLLVLLALLALLLPVVELIRRAWSHVRGNSPSNRLALNTPRLPGRPRRLLAGWESPQIVLLLIVAPIAGGVISGLLAADAVASAKAIETSGVITQAIVDTSAWGEGDGAGSLDVRFELPDGTEASAQVDAHGSVHYEGAAVEVIYAPAEPRSARLSGPSGDDPAPLIYASIFVAFLATVVVAVPTAIGTLIRRTRNAG